MSAFGQGNVLSSTLMEITTTKLQELSKRRSDYESRRSQVTQALSHEKDSIKRLQILSTGIRSCFGITQNSDGSSSSSNRTVGATADYYTSGLGTELDNLDLFVSQAQYDPSVSVDMATRLEESLLKYLDMRSLKFQYASLYAELVTEWLSSEKASKVGKDADDDMSMQDDDDDYEDVAKMAKKEAREYWEEVVFNAAEVDEQALQDYLTEIFGIADPNDTAHDGHHTALQELRYEINGEENFLDEPEQFNAQVLRWVCDGLLSAGSLSDEKRQVLQEFKNNPIIMTEVADVLNMRMQSIESWVWNPEGVQVDQERQINGLYNVVMREDLLQALLLQYIGVKWSVIIKSALKKFRKLSGSAWLSPLRKIDQQDRVRRKYYLGKETKSGSVQATRDSIYRKRHFLSMLKNDVSDRFEYIAGEQEAAYCATSPAAQAPRYAPQQPAPMLQQANSQRLLMARAPMAAQAPMRKLGSKAYRRRAYTPTSPTYSPASPEDESSDDEDSVDTDHEADLLADTGPKAKPKTLSEIKQSLLRLLSTEIAINTKLHGQLTAFHSLFESWNSRLPHQTVLGVLKFVGVSKKWLGFFKKFLAAPLKFTEDGGKAVPRPRLRGAPGSQILSEVFGETTLFCLDLAVNRSTSGTQLWRLQEEIWFWSPDAEVVQQAWESVKRFQEVTGSEINYDKSGSICVDLGQGSKSQGKAQSSALETLPKGSIRWGFLRLSATTGQFEIDQNMVDENIRDLRKQLYGKRGSIIAFIQAWNTYATTFFTHNFGKPANCFGQQHVEQMLTTHNRVQRAVFSKQEPPHVSLAEGTDEVPSMVDFLKKELHRRFGVTDIPDAYLFFPTDMGGLDLRSPFVSILQVHKTVLTDPAAEMTQYIANEHKAYKTLADRFADGKHPGRDDHPFHKRRQIEGVGAAASGNDIINHFEFMPFSEFIEYREDVSLQNPPFPNNWADLGSVYRKLLQVPPEQGVTAASKAVQAALGQLSTGRRAAASGDGGNGLPEFLPRLDMMEPYWRWIVAMYGPEVVERFGGLHIVEPGLLPMGMVRMFREKKVQWEG